MGIVHFDGAFLEMSIGTRGTGWGGGLYRDRGRERAGRFHRAGFGVLGGSPV